MKSMSPALAALLATGDYEFAECWTITLNGGAVVRWTGADQSIFANGNTFQALGGSTASTPAISHGAISEKRGIEVSTLEVDITATDADLIDGSPVIPFIARRGLDGATVKLEYAFAPDWPSLIAGATGTVIRFAGRVTAVTGIQGATAKITVSAWTVLLNINMPRNLCQAPCMHILYDSGCTLSPASFSAAGQVVGSGATQSFASNLSPSLNYYAQGRIVFSSGLNEGLTATVKSNGTDGTIALVSPMPSPLADGDTFTIYAGCDLLMSTCSTKFNNLDNFKGTPFVPQPVTPLGSQTTVTTGGGGKG